MSTQPTNSPAVVSVVTQFPATPRTTAEVRQNLTPFDQREYQRLIEARGATICAVLRRLKPLLHLATAIDAGCGVGFFAKLLHQCGLAVAGFDGRAVNIAEARRRFPAIPFEVADIEDAGIPGIGQFDLVLCFGLLYHLENPLRAIRHLRALTGKCLLLESMCTPSSGPELLLCEEPRQDDQSLTELACCASEPALVKILYRAGFAVVYRIAPLPDHDDFRDTNQHARRRTVLLATDVPLDVPGFRFMPEPGACADPWRQASETQTFPRRFARFLTSSRRRKYVTTTLRLRRFFPRLPIPLRLSFGAWWLAEDSALDRHLMYDRFEAAELRFVEQFLQPGMTVVDAGAHHGLYSLLASSRVGRHGKVLAVEPSVRERARLRRHLSVNRCANVLVCDCALGAENGDANLHVVDGEHDWFNSLRQPKVCAPNQIERVPVRRLDEIVADAGIRQIDFVKLDVEGAELSVLEGMCALLKGRARPVVLAEVQDQRTEAWGYPACRILQYLENRDYRWFALTPEGLLNPFFTAPPRCDGNFVGVPEERLAECAHLVAPRQI